MLYTADTLSRAPSKATDDSPDLPEEVETFIESVVATLPASEQRLEMYRQARYPVPSDHGVLQNWLA